MKRRYVRVRVVLPAEFHRVVQDCRVYALGKRGPKDITHEVPASLAGRLWLAPLGARLPTQLFRLRAGVPYMRTRRDLATEPVVLKVAELESRA